MVEECLLVPGTLAVCIREVQKSLMQSSKRLIESKIQSLGVGDQFKILHDRIITPGDGLIIFQGMQDATAESIKSLKGLSDCVGRRGADAEPALSTAPNYSH
jgi:phage terminase large subunit